jgi:hypothetical protein
VSVLLFLLVDHADRAYGDNEKDTAGKFEGKPSVYWPSKTMSVQGGLLKKNVHTENGVPMAGGLFVKVNPADNEGARSYGKHTVRFRVTKKQLHFFERF